MPHSACHQMLNGIGCFHAYLLLDERAQPANCMCRNTNNMRHAYQQYQNHIRKPTVGTTQFTTTTTILKAIRKLTTATTNGTSPMRGTNVDRIDTKRARAMQQKQNNSKWHQNDTKGMAWQGKSRHGKVWLALIKAKAITKQKIKTLRQ